MERIDSSIRDREIDNMVRQEIVRREAPPFEKWYLRKRARQAVLPFELVQSQGQLADSA